MTEFLQTTLSGRDAAQLDFAPEAEGSGTATLYRAEAAPTGRRPPEWIKEAQDRSGHTEASGRWFTSQQDALVWYLRDAGPRARVFTVDVPASDLDALRVSNTKEVIAGRSVASFSRDPANEYFLPRALVTLRKEVSCWIGEAS
jgi:hypothetical protein